MGPFPGAPSNVDDGGPASPTSYDRLLTTGDSIRDRLAMAALIGIVVNEGYIDAATLVTQVDHAYDYADAAIQRRKS